MKLSAFGTRLAAFALFASLSFPRAATAKAQLDDLSGFDDNSPPPEYKGSARHFALEIKFGQYSPNIDATTGLTGHPFAELFNSQLTPNSANIRPAEDLLSTVSFEWQFWRPFGTLAVAGSLGYQGRTTHSFQYSKDASGNMAACQVPNCVRSSDTDTLNLIPVTLELVYRFDVLAERYGVPIVPYLKGGLGYDLWFVLNAVDGLSSSLTTPSSPGIGGTFGLVAHPGIAFQLDWLDPAAAHSFDAEVGVNHTYVFVELNYAWITGFGVPGKMVLSDTSWNAGLAFEF